MSLSEGRGAEIARREQFHAGTGIGRRNLGAFHCFVTLLCVCVVLDVLIVMRVMP